MNKRHECKPTKSRNVQQSRFYSHEFKKMKFKNVKTVGKKKVKKIHRQIVRSFHSLFNDWAVLVAVVLIRCHNAFMNKHIQYRILKPMRHERKKKSCNTMHNLFVRELITQSVSQWFPAESTADKMMFHWYAWAFVSTIQIILETISFFS